jgi:hypothetical protein
MRIKEFKPNTFTIWVIIYGFITFVTLCAAFAEDEGIIGTSLVLLILAKLFYLFRFPTHPLLWSIMAKSGSFEPVMFFGGLILNCLFYAFLTERLFYFLKKRKRSITN